MTLPRTPRGRTARRLLIAATLLAAIAVPLVAWNFPGTWGRSPHWDYSPRQPLDTGGYTVVGTLVGPWDPNASLKELSDRWDGAANRSLAKLDAELAQRSPSDVAARVEGLVLKASILNYEGEPKKAYQALEEIQTLLKGNEALAREAYYSTLYLQGVSALRRGENENCLMCRGESSCILPISEAARHTNPAGSRLAIQHFTQYLNRFPNDLEVKWLLNIAHMTLGEHPEGVDPRYRLSLEHFQKSEFDIGRFRDIGHLVGVNQLTQAGGAIMEDFDNDGLLDLAITTFDPTGQMNLLRNTGRGTFEDRTAAAGLTGQLGGLNCVQTDYNNDGRMDIFVVRGAWLPRGMRPTLLRNESDGTFTDVTEEAGLLEPANSIAAQWGDYDNDGWLDLFICCERQPSRLYHNLKNGRFEEVSQQAGIRTTANGKGAAWTDYDNDGYPDLFVQYLNPYDPAKLYRNNRDGTFTDVGISLGVNGPTMGFSCWTWDYDNDGWLDLFATCYDRSLGDVVQGVLGQPHSRNSNRLYRNLQGRGFQDVTKEAGLDMVFATMGSNFADLDNDGYLDMYLGTGEPDIATLIPNRMFRNVDGKRFSEITASSGTGNLQKGHGVACGDWDRDGNVDVFIEMGGAINGDKYHNILFQNPGHDNNWVTVKLAGEKSNRAAIGARIKIVTAGPVPRTFYRHVSSGSSFGANPLQQTIGLGKADRIETLEITWPTTKATQTFHDIAVDQAIRITEFATDYEKLEWAPVTVPKAEPVPGMMTRVK